MAKKRNLKTSLVMLLFLLAILSTVRAEIIYVDAESSPGGDGQTWWTAYKYLQDSLGAVVSGDQIWVADGIYKPDANTGNPTGTGDRLATFELKNGVTFKAGYAGFGEPDPNARDIEVYETVLSGDLLGNDGQGFANNYENSYHIVTGSGTNDTAVLDGFIITAGNADGSNLYRRGGGMYNDNGSPTLTNCIFICNSAVFGGGMGNYNFSNPTLTNCTFSGNRTIEWTGGGMANWSSSPTLTNCTFSGNSAVWDGGGMWNYDFSNPTLTNCTFSGNSSGCDGGGMLNYSDCSPMLTNCTFSGNSAISNGGVMANFSRCNPTLTNCILWGNTASSRSPIYNANASCWVTVSYSNVQGGWPGEANIDADPLFAEPGYWADVNDLNVVVEPDDPNAIWIDGDYRLKSEAGRWESVSESWVLDDVTSPCIDRGDPHSPVGDEPDPNGGRINMGAYGGTSEASMSIGQPPPLPPLAHWKLDETEGPIAYDSVGDYDGILTGEPVWQPDGGMVDGALQFDGTDDYVSTDPVLNPADGKFSVVAWIKGGAPGQTVLSQADGSNWLCLDSVEGCLTTELKGSGRSPGGPLSSKVIITDGTWHRIGLVWDGSYRCLYVDGVEVARDAELLSSPESAEGGLYFGAGSTLAPDTYFSGLIDDIRIYNRAVSP